MRLSLLFSLLSLAVHCSASILAIDYGAEWSKASLMKPGVPFDVVLTRDSKRKLNSLVGWKGQERLFGSEAGAVATRFPLDSFPSLKYLLGVPYTEERAFNHSEISLSKTLASSRDTFALERQDGTTWDVEELVAMQLGYIKELAEGLGGEQIKEAVVTVPGYWSQFQRQALIDSLEIAGLKPLALVNDGTAVAINFAMTRSFPTPETYVIYDAGASSIRATVVTFHSRVADPSPPATTSARTITKKEKEATHVEVKGLGWDLAVGGDELDRRVRVLLEEDFEKKAGVQLKGPRPFAKLAKEAARVKAILSANADSAVTIESLFEDIDYRSRLSREQFEAACEDLKERFTQPIVEALQMAGMTLDNVTSVILTGGASRTPMIQSKVIEFVGKEKIAQNVNADESAVLGAAFYGASLSPLYRTKEIRVQEIVPYPVQLSYAAGTRTINTLVFGQGSKAGVKKTVSLKRKEDFNVQFSYKEPPTNLPAEILDVAFEGVAAAAQNLTEGGAKEVVAKLTVQYSESGIASVREAVLVGEGYDQTFAGALKGFFGGSKEGVEQDGEQVPMEDATAAEPAPPAKGEAKDDVKKEIPLAFSAQPLSIIPLTYSQKSESRKRLVALDNAEQSKRKWEEERNQLESYIYRLRDVLNSEPGTVFYDFSAEHERAALHEAVQEAFAWMQDEAELAELEVLRTKKEALQQVERPIQNRVKEAEDWPKSLSDLQRALTAGRIFLTEALQNRTSEIEEVASKYLQEELEAVQELLEKTESWLREGLATMENWPKHQDAPIKTVEMNIRGRGLQEMVTKLMRRRIPKKPKSTASTTSTASTSTSTEEAPTPSVESQTEQPTPSAHTREEL